MIISRKKNLVKRKYAKYINCTLCTKYCIKKLKADYAQCKNKKYYLQNNSTKY